MTSEERNAATVDRILPENDGMSLLRKKLQEIRTLAISTEEKAKRMHDLMMADYTTHRSLHDPPTSPSFSHDSDKEGRPQSPLFQDVDSKNPYNIQPGDFDVTFAPMSVNANDLDTALDDGSDDEDLIPDLGCIHYKRNVKLQCYDCRRWFPCRHCHDQADNLPFPHVLNRKKTENMLCMLCQTPQPASEICIKCGEYAAWYYCSKCKLWENDSNKKIYHCDDCGICRVGEGLGKDFVHCRRCNVCISISTSESHPCIERATEGNCPLCLISLFESRTAVVSLPCGHYMHGDCYQNLMAVTYKCPVCSKSAINMELQWRKLDDAIQVQPMPEDDAELEGLLPHLEAPPEDAGVPPAGTETGRQRRPRAVWIACNDCGGRSWTPFHWLGLKCQTCDSYNTNQMAPSAGHETEAERIMRQQHVHAHHDFTGNSILAAADATAATPVPVPPTSIPPGPPPASRADSALDVPPSPISHPVSPPPVPQPTSPGFPSSSATSAQSPGRYFVQDDPPRRPSFTGPRFSAPTMPNLPSLSDMPRMPRMPNIELLPRRFSPYEMLNAVSRSLSPMRYYLQGLDLRDDNGNGNGNGSHNGGAEGRNGGAAAAAAETGNGNGDGEEVVGSSPTRQTQRASRPRPVSVQSEPARSFFGPFGRPRLAGSGELKSWNEESLDHERGSESESGEEEEDEEEDELDAGDDEDEDDDDEGGEIEIFGHP